MSRWSWVVMFVVGWAVLTVFAFGLGALGTKFAEPLGAGLAAIVVGPALFVFVRWMKQHRPKPNAS